ncbi:JAB1/Mov34/MPN/PAD-1 ubiquitin protease [Carpediemonas membranifera]|uniref:COP9 signalosome complex subunit 5 n=1 Tax=Carpediemonas membranifera TaxID=201153 RepID=A0A8J6AQK5_9EUKA|nr:JAB1/Mov34/MPN/PAD-1 ubiquitin protease [Carpediemonas membranifera]|eukprot:KAG9391153.1 JAB1/Mov34/MPN/PAD-1 ubiquitin protease [Carpediemonas membranifera]
MGHEHAGPVALRAEHQRLKQLKPYRNDPYYFKSVEIYPTALLKMAIHTSEGGDLEVMGMLQGYIAEHKFIIVDCFALPVEGTETRVNAHEQAFAFMIDVIQSNEDIGRTDVTLGWYHSHPDYGCWLSGIDVTTQALHQRHEDPFVAIVVDPIRTLSGSVEIGAFRTFPDDFVPAEGAGSSVGVSGGDKTKDYGRHADRYYELPVRIMAEGDDSAIIDQALRFDWVQTLTAPGSDGRVDRAVAQLLDPGKKAASAKMIGAELARRDMVRRGLAGIFS